MAAGGGSIWAEEDCEGKSMPASILSLHYCGRTPGEEAAILHFSFHLVCIINIQIDLFCLIVILSLFSQVVV